MNKLPLELIIEIFDKINLSDFKSFITLSKINKKFNFVYKKYFEEKLKNFKPYIPLSFWFNRNAGFCIPYCYLPYTNTSFSISFNPNPNPN
jgi:hypothetical protein